MGAVRSHVLAQPHHDVLAGVDPAVALSWRARDGLADLRENLPFARADAAIYPRGAHPTYLVHSPGEAPTWWTFDGGAANTTLRDGRPALVDSDIMVGPLRLGRGPTQV